MKQGFSVNTPLSNYSSSVSGVFSGEEDDFNDSRHLVRVNSSPGTRLREAAAEIKPQKITQQVRKPVLTHFYDNGSETQDETITPGKGARITGDLLKFDEEDANQGIFFVNTADGSETKADSPMLRNKPGELIFLNPDLAAGTYRLEVRAIIHRTSEPRTGSLTEQLTAVAAP